MMFVILNHCGLSSQLYEYIQLIHITTLYHRLMEGRPWGREQPSTPTHHRLKGQV